MKIIKRIFELIKLGAPRNQYYLEVGVYLLKKGTGHQIGDLAYTQKIAGKERAFYVSELFYDFKRNKITHKLSNTVIKAEDEKAG